LEINNLESAALPNKRAVIECFNQLTSAIYLGFYSKRALHPDTLEDSIGERLYPAETGFVEQITRAGTYEDRSPRPTIVGGHSVGPPRWSEGVVLRLYQQLPELRRVLNTDVIAAYEGDPAANSIEEIVFSYPAVRTITAYRIAHLLYAEGVPM